MKRHLALAIAIAATFPFSAPSEAEAGQTLTVHCTRSRMVEGMVSCDKSALYRFDSQGEDFNYGLELTAPLSHCSSTQYRVLESGTRNFIASTGYLQPGQSQLVELGNGFLRGVNKVLIVAWGKVEGCNTGTMHSWAVDVHPVALP